MKNISLIIVLFASAFLLFDNQAIAQQVTSLNCPPTAAIPGQEEALRSLTKEYLTALQAKNWGSMSGFDTSTLTSNRNLDFGQADSTVTLMRDLLQPLQFDEVAFEIKEVNLKPCEATVRYTLSLKAAEPQTRKTLVEFSNLKKVIEWRRFECECVHSNITEWKMIRDVVEGQDLPKALATARTQHEQRLLLLGKSDEDLHELASGFRVQGFELIDREGASKAFDMLRLAQVVLEQIKYHESSDELAKVHELEMELAEARRAADSNREAYVLGSLGNAYLNLQRYEQALKALDGVLKLTDLNSMPGTAATIYAALARSRLELREYDQAISYYLKSLERYQAVRRKATTDKDADEEALEQLFGVVFKLEVLYEAQGRDDLAQSLHAKILNSLGQAEVQAGFQFVLADLNKRSGSISKAARYIEAYASFVESAMNSPEATPEGKAILNFQIGTFHKEAGNITRAIKYMKASLDAAKEMRTADVDDGEVFKAQAILGPSTSLFELYLQERDYEKAAKYLLEMQEVLKGEEEEDQKRLDYITPAFESIFYQSQGDQRLADFRRQQAAGITKDFIRESLNESTEAGAIVAQLMISAGETWSQGKWQEAYDRYSLALRLTEEVGDEEGAARICGSLGGLYESRQKYIPALEIYSKGLQHVKKIPLLSDLSLTDVQELTAELEWAIGGIQTAMGNYDQALHIFRSVLDRKNILFYRQEGANALIVIAGLYFTQKKYDEALNAIEEGLSIIKATGNRAALPALYYFAGKSQRALKQYELAASSFDKAIAEIEARRAGIVGEQTKERFFEDNVGPYHEMISMFVEQNKCHQALQYAERSKSQVLLDVLQQGKFDISDSLTDEEREQELELRGNLVAAERQFASAQGKQDLSATVPAMESLRKKRVDARLEFEAFHANLLLKYSKRKMSRNSQGGISSAQAAKLLPREGGALLEFALTDEKTYLFVLTDGDRNTRSASALTRCAVHEIPIGISDLKGQVASLRQRIGHEDGVVQPLARQLYDLLLKPAQAALTGKTTLVIVPDQDLWYLPFQALQPRDGHYLLEESVVYYAPSLTSLTKMKNVSAGPHGRRNSASPSLSPGKFPTLLVMANPLNPDMEPLPRTEVQAPKIAKLYGTRNVRVYAREQATESRFKKEAPAADIIHIGAHGIFESDDPLHSRVVLSYEKKREGDAADSLIELQEDGMLEAWEIMNLKLKANMIVLSACDTARGRVGDGEGIVGLTWALFMAGVPSTVVSQWKVDEGATTELMYLFHENFIKGGRSGPPLPRKAEALRQASLKLLGSEKYRHPYYWAGFVLIGDGN